MIYAFVSTAGSKMQTSVELIVSTKEEPEKKWNFRVSNIMLNINARNLFLVFKEYYIHSIPLVVAWPHRAVVH